MYPVSFVGLPFGHIFVLFILHEQECLSDIKHESAARVFYISDTEITTANVLNGLSDPSDEFIGEIILKLNIV